MRFVLQNTTVFLLLLVSSIGNAQFRGFSVVENTNKLEYKMPRTNFPEVYTLFQTDFSSLNAYLLNAPDEFDTNAGKFLVELPSKNGKSELFAMYKSSIFEKALSSEFTGIYSYKGYNLKDPSYVIRMSVSHIHGMHIMGSDKAGNTYYTDTYTQDLNTYISYNRKDLVKSSRPYNCLSESANKVPYASKELVNNQIQNGMFRKFRLAVATTVEYSAFHINNAPSGVPVNTIFQKKAVVLSAINITLNRVNVVYEKDLAVRLTLVGNNGNIIFINNDEFSNNNAGALIDESQLVIDQNIGSENYDIGHTFSTGGGGLASLASVCSSSYKASGITGLGEPVGDPYDVDYVCHEVGHQFGAKHTFNGLSGSCNDNISYVSAEPGSGSTIMAYAGLCSPNNVQMNSDPYFHYYSLKQINDFFLSTQAVSCSTVLSQNNAFPVVQPMLTKHIPVATPFRLFAKADDDNNPNTLSYCWEQTDLELIDYPMSSTNTVGPAFRSLLPVDKEVRYFPSLATVKDGVTDYTAVPSSIWEKLPTVSRTMNFVVTVRDNNINGGHTKSESQQVIFENVPPFYLTYPSNLLNNEQIQWEVNTTQTITWNVGGTTLSSINTTHVNIYYTVDEGETFHILLNNTPNDGSETILVPDLANAAELRILIEPVNNIYYAISQPVFISNLASIDTFNFKSFQLYPNPTDDVIHVSFSPENSSNISLELFDVNGRLLINNNYKNNGSFSEVISLKKLAGGTYFLKITNGNRSVMKKVMK